MNFSIKGKFVDILNRSIWNAEITIEDGRIKTVVPVEEHQVPDQYIMPGFIDSHVHIESSMLVPGEFARLAVVHGTVGTVSDPHEIANVCGIEGVEYMIENGSQVPFKFHFGAPSCVPATIFETAGAEINVQGIEKLLQREDVLYLAEMMNFPGVLHHDPEVKGKIDAALRMKKPVDGHAPGLRGEQAKQYIAAGISTDHECFTADEALEKLGYGMKILIREGSAAKNFEALAGLINEHWENMMFCSDDKHPDSLAAGHINDLCSRAVKKGLDIFKVLQVACINPVNHYHLNVGLLKPGDPADFILVKDLTGFRVIGTYIDGQLVAENSQTLIKAPAAAVINQFACTYKVPGDFRYNYPADVEQVPVVEALDGQLITNKVMFPLANLKTGNGVPESNIAEDVLKLVVINRYHDAPVAKAWIKNFGLKNGAVASTVAHDSHNIIAVGTDDDSLCRAVNLLIEQKGGVSCVADMEEVVIALPVAGLMSTGDGYLVAEQYTAIDNMAKSLGSQLSAPFMTLSFMALLVIPHLKLSDKGLFDGDRFTFV